MVQTLFNQWQIVLNLTKDYQICQHQIQLIFNQLNLASLSISKFIKELKMQGFSNEQISHNQASSLSRSRRGVRSSGSHSNMKSISRFIMLLLHIYGEVAVHTIFLVVCQIVSGSQLGKEIASKGLERKEFDVVDAVNKKSNDPFKQDHQRFTTIMRNVRRRIYDVINVLVASKIIIKDKKIIRLASRLKKKSQNVLAKQNEIQKNKIKIEAVKAQSDKLEIKEKVIRNIYERNMKRDECQPVEKIMFPLTALMLKPTATISLESHTIEVKSSSSLQLFGQQISIKKTHKSKTMQQQQFQLEEGSIPSLQ